MTPSTISTRMNLILAPLMFPKRTRRAIAGHMTRSDSSNGVPGCLFPRAKTRRLR
jgi:hypothetical protein